MIGIHGLTALDQAAAIRSGDVSPVELVTHYLERIDQLGPALGAFITVTTDRALGQARAAADLARTDPAVRAGRLEVEAMSWLCPPGTMATGGLVLMVLLAGIAWMVTRQVVVPVRAAALKLAPVTTPPVPATVPLPPTLAAALVRNTTLEPYRTLTLYPVSPASELEAHSKVVLATIGVEGAGLAGIGPVVLERLVGQVQQVER